MPNTLIHIAIQAPTSRAIFPQATIPWILAGTIIPDIPWICQRIAMATDIFDPFQIRLYCTIQASLIFCLLFSAALAAFGCRPLSLFILLTFNCVIHLLLDSLQIKWGMGVHLFAPFTWQLTSLGLLWPEHILGYITTVFALVYLVLKLRAMEEEGLDFHLPSGRMKGPAAILFICYLALPLTLMDQLEQSEHSNIRTLQESATRTGKAIELDRVHYLAEGSKITVFSGETINLTGSIPKKSGTISLKGEFTAPNTIRSNKFHMHNAYRNFATYLGLFLTIAIWSYLLLTKHSATRKRILK